MRFEGKNGYFAGMKYKNFKNLPLTLCMRHQLYMAYKQAGTCNGYSESYLYAGDSVHDGNEVIFRDLFPALVESFSHLIGLDICDSSVYLTSGVSIHGSEFIAGCALVLEYCHDEPVFAILQSIVVRDHMKYFIVDKVHTTFEPHIISYVFTDISGRLIIPYTSLKFRWPLPIYNYNGVFAIMNIHSHTYSHPL
jgi:hypothetical protein